MGYLFALSPLVGTAAAGNAAQSREYLEKATAAYALNRYAIAAENYEKAYELAPEPAILYNAAQAHRLAGNKERALELYEGYGRVYADDKREEIAKHIESLRKAIEHDKEVASSPPKTMATVKDLGAQTEPAKPETDLPNAPAPKTEANRPMLVSLDHSPQRPLTSKLWFWGAVAGGGLAMTVAVLLLASGGDSAASPSMGRIAGN